SACPKRSPGEGSDAHAGYRPAIEALLLQLAENLRGPCSKRLDVGSDQRVDCHVIEVSPVSLSSFISINWRGSPLRTYETIISLIGNTTNRGGLVVRARLDRRKYPTGKKVSAKELRELKLERDDFHGDWNYVITPRTERR